MNNFNGMSKSDPERYRKIWYVLSDKGVKKDFLDRVETVPLEYVYNLADAGPSPEDAACTTETKTIINEALTDLDPRRERLLRGLFGIGCDKMTITELSDQFLVTKGRIHSLKNSALHKLKLPNKKYARKLRSAL